MISPPTKTILIMAWVMALTVKLHGAETWQYGPLSHAYHPVLDGGLKQEWFGPLAYHHQTDHGTQWAFNGLVSFLRDDRIDATEWDILYPLLSHERFGQEAGWKLLNLWSLNQGVGPEGTLQSRWSLFPFFFHDQAVGDQPAKTAWMPFYGTIGQRFLRDETQFFLWPLYVKTRKRDIITYNLLAPLLHWRKGDHLKGWQWLPLGSWETRMSHTRTYADGRVETIPGYRKKSLLWPLFQYQQLGLGSENPSTRSALIPFYRYEKSLTRTSWTFPWPLGVTHASDTQGNYREWGLPWPAVVWADGSGKTTRRLWPLGGVQITPTQRRAFLAWPLYRYTERQTPETTTSRHQILFHLYKHSETIQQNDPTSLSQRWSVWPLFIRQQGEDGSMKTQWPAPLESLFGDHETINRHYSGLWAIWRSAHDTKRGSHSYSFLWNTWRLDKTPEEKTMSLLFGLLRYKQSHQQPLWTLLGLPLNRLKDTP